MEPPLPLELQPFRGAVQNYTNAKVRQFATAFTRRLGLNVPPAQLDAAVQETLSSLAPPDATANRALRLVLRHDCQSTGCGDSGCLLCQYNPSRLCKRNIKAKYLIDDQLKAKCGAALRVELVDETNACVTEGLPPGMQLECLVMNGEKYKEICPDNTLLTHSQLRTCIISHHQRALLRREGGSDDQLRCFLQLERGQAVLSDLQVTTSSEALLAGKAPTFRLLLWAVDAHGEPLVNVTYVISEHFVVATKRVKHAIKSDIPSVSDHVSKLVHIGKATVDKLLDLRSAAHEEGFEIQVPDELNRVDRVGTFQQLVELTEMNTDLKNKVRHLLKLSPEKWEEVATHAQSAVVPDFRQRAWWCPAVKAGLLFACKNGAVCMDQPLALIKMGGKGEDDQVIPTGQLDVQLFNTIPKLKAQAVQSWYAPSHPGWAIYYKEGGGGGGNGAGQSKMDALAGLNGGAAGLLAAGGGAAAPPAMRGTTNGGAPTSVFAVSQAGVNGATPPLPSPSPLLGLQQHSPQLGMGLGGGPQGGPVGGAAGDPTKAYLSAFTIQNPALAAAAAQTAAAGASAPQLASALMQAGGLAGQGAGTSGGGAAGGSGGGAAKSPFAVPQLMGGLQDHFPAWQSQGGGGPTGQPGHGNDSIGVSMLLNQLGNSLVPNSLPIPGGPSGNGGDGGRPEDGSLDRGLSHLNGLLDGPSAAWPMGPHPPIPMLGGSASLNGSLNQTINALIQDHVDRTASAEPPTKMQRTMPPESTVL